MGSERGGGGLNDNRDKSITASDHRLTSGRGCTDIAAVSKGRIHEDSGGNFSIIVRIVRLNKYYGRNDCGSWHREITRMSMVRRSGGFASPIGWRSEAVCRHALLDVF